MRDKLMRVLDFSGSVKNPGKRIFMKNGMKIWKIMVKISRAKNRNEKIFLTNASSSPSVFLCWVFSMKSGTNAELKAPSAKIRRKKFGRRKAAKKASDNMLTPRYCAMRISRMKPRTREIEMKNETVKTERKMGII